MAFNSSLDKFNLGFNSSLNYLNYVTDKNLHTANHGFHLEILYSNKNFLLGLDLHFIYLNNFYLKITIYLNLICSFALCLIDIIRSAINILFDLTNI